MESCLMSYFVFNDELRNTCDFNPYLFENKKPVYEVVRVEKGIPLFFKDHIDRFYNSCKLADLLLSLSRQQIYNRIKVLIESNNLKTGLVKFLLLQEKPGEELFLAWVAPFFFPSKEQYLNGVELALMNGVRENPHVKLANLSVRQRADALIKEKKNYDVILVNSDGIITEGSRSNLFFLKNDCKVLFTPHESLVLTGITRIKIIDLALGLGLDVFESVYTVDELEDFDSLFQTGTSPKVLPVNRVGEKKFDTKNRILGVLRENYDKMIDDYIRNFSW
jgi:branched-chain amino acid aminotransferase